MSMTVLQAMHDPALFGAEFDAPTWTSLPCRPAG